MNVKENPTTNVERYLAEERAREQFHPPLSSVVRLRPDVGNATQQRILWKVTAIDAPQNDGVVFYTIEPVTGGRSLKAENVHLRPATEQEVKIANELPPSVPMMSGTVGLLSQPVLRGAVLGQPMVVVGENTDGTVKVAPLNGGPRFSRCPRSALHVVEAVIPD